MVEYEEYLHCEDIDLIRRTDKDIAILSQVKHFLNERYGGKIPAELPDIKDQKKKPQWMYIAYAKWAADHICDELDRMSCEMPHKNMIENIIELQYEFDYYSKFDHPHKDIFQTGYEVACDVLDYATLVEYYWQNIHEGGD